MTEILESVGLKTCSKCKQTLPVSEFGKKSASKDGLYKYCRPCANEEKRQYRNENHEHAIEYQHQYRNENHEYHRKHQVQCITNHAIARGELIRPDACPQCGANEYKVQAHHWSYEPGDELDVIWLCPRCHMALHQRNKID